MPSRLCALVLCLFSIPCLAADNEDSRKQVSVQIYLVGAHDLTQCKLESEIIQEELRSLTYPPGWRIEIVCTSSLWEKVRQARDLKPYTRAFTNLEAKATVFDGAIFHGLTNEYHHIVAHELGHIKCQCADEDKVEKLAAQLEKTSRVKPNSAEN